MKRVFLLVLVLFVFTMTAFADNLDLPDMSYDELLALKQAVDAEINTRPEAEIVCPVGTYIVGESWLQPGKYYVTLSEFGNYSHSFFTLYPDMNSYTNLRYLSPRVTNNIYSGDVVGVNLEIGYVLVIEYLPLKFRMKPFDDEELLSYTPPEGTAIPSGTYHVGKEIPAGTYEVFADSAKTSNILICETEENYENYKSDATIEVFPRQPDEPFILTIADGNVLVFRGSVVMRKSQQDNPTQFEFD